MDFSKNSISQNDLMYFKNEVLGNLKKMETNLKDTIKLVDKIIEDKLNPYQNKFEEMNNKIFDLSNLIAKDRTNFEKINQLLLFKQKTEDLLISQENRIIQCDKDISKACFKYDKLLLTNVMIPGLIGEHCKYPSLKAYIENNISQINNLNSIKEKQTVEVKNCKDKVDNLVKQFTIQIENVKKLLSEQFKTSILITEEKFERKCSAWDEKHNEMRIQNGKYAIELKQKSESLTIEWEKLLHFKEEIFERLDKEKQHFDKTHQNTMSIFEKNKKEMIFIKNKFSQLNDIIKDLRFKKKDYEFKKENKVKQKKTDSNRKQQYIENNNEIFKEDLNDEKVENFQVQSFLDGDDKTEQKYFAQTVTDPNKNKNMLNENVRARRTRIGTVKSEYVSPLKKGFHDNESKENNNLYCYLTVSPDNIINSYKNIPDEQIQSGVSEQKVNIVKDTIDIKEKFYNTTSIFKKETEQKELIIEPKLTSKSLKLSSINLIGVDNQKKRNSILIKNQNKENIDKMKQKVLNEELNKKIIEVESRIIQHEIYTQKHLNDLMSQISKMHSPSSSKNIHNNCRKNNKFIFDDSYINSVMNNSILNEEEMFTKKKNPPSVLNNRLSYYKNKNEINPFIHKRNKSYNVLSKKLTNKTAFLGHDVYKSEKQSPILYPISIIFKNQPKYLPKEKANLLLKQIEPILIKEFQKKTY